MRSASLEWLRCPECDGEGELDLEPLDESTADDVEEGTLRCRTCTRVFPIINGIPRMLPDALAHVVLRYHAKFFARHAGAMGPYVQRAASRVENRWWRAERRTVNSYSYQWRKFKQMFPEWEQVFLDRSEEHTSELQSLAYLVCRLLLAKKNHFLRRGG